MSEIGYWFMKNWLQSTPERGRFRPRRGRFSASSILMLLLLGGLLVWAPTARAQTPLIINHIDNTNIDIALNPTLTILVSVANTDVLTNDPVIFVEDPVSVWPSGTALTTRDEKSAIFTWSPSPQQVGMVTNLSVQAHRAAEPALLNSTNFIVTVTSSAPVANTPGFGPISGQTVNAGTMLQFYTYATNTDNSTNFIRFTLDTSSPTNATLTNYLSTIITNATSTNGYFVGNFTWTPDLSQVGPHPMKAIATEAATSLSATQAFSVNVILTNNCNQYTQFLNTVAAGGPIQLTDCPTLFLSNTITIATNVFLDALSGSVTIAGNNLLRLFTVLPGASLTLNGVTLQGGSSDRGGAIYNSGTVVLSNCIVAGNNAVGASGINGTDGDNDANYGKDGTDASPGLAGRSEEHTS